MYGVRLPEFSGELCKMPKTRGKAKMWNEVELIILLKTRTIMGEKEKIRNILFHTKV